MAIFAIIIFVVLIWLVIRCYSKESEISGTLKYFNVCNRFHSYLTICLLLSGPMGLIGALIPVIQGEGGFLNLLLSAAFAAVLFFLGLLMFKRAKSRCPEHLKKKLFGMMLMATFGIGIKICLFFMPLIWALSPKLAKATDGKEYIIDGMDVYNTNGRLIGKYDPSTGEITFFPGC